MKYPKEEYEQTEFYTDDETVINHKQKVVVVRKPHTCVNCKKEIKKGECALYESAFMDSQPVSCYTCIECCDKWLDETLSNEE